MSRIKEASISPFIINLVLLSTLLFLAAMLMLSHAGTAKAQTLDGTNQAPAMVPVEKSGATVEAVDVAMTADSVPAEAVDEPAPEDAATQIDEPGQALLPAKEDSAGNDGDASGAMTAQTVPGEVQDGENDIDEALLLSDPPRTTDHDGDGNTELAVLYDYSNSNSALWLFDPSASGYNGPTGAWTSGAGNWEWSRSKIVSSDYNGDGNTELAVLYDYGNANTGLWLFDPSPSGYNPPRLVWASGAGNWDWNRSQLAPSDYNGDNKTEIAVLYDYGNSTSALWLFDPTPTGYSAPRNVWSNGYGNWDASGSKMVGSDYNGDGKTELAVLYDYGNSNSALWLFDPSATGYNSPRGAWTSGAGNWSWAYTKLVTSDYNGDGKTEIAALYDYGNSNSALWLFDPSATGYNGPRGAWTSGAGNWSWIRSRLVASDYNGDGKTEIAVLYNYGNSNSALWLFDPSATGYNGPRGAWTSGAGNWEWYRSRLPQTSAFMGRTYSTGIQWIDINLSSQTLNAYGRKVYEIAERYYIYTVSSIFSTLVSTGGPGHATPTGNFHVYAKNMYTDMSGPGYYAPDVPFVLWFYTDYSIHGTYWHNDFGWPHTHGCVNLPTPAAHWLFDRVPVGMPVYVHY